MTHHPHGPERAELAARLEKAANNAECWADSYTPANDYRQHRWLTNYASIMREAAAALSAPPDDWRDDPAADERWQAGLDFAMVEFCKVLGIDPESVNWDAATETLDGDVNAVICNILRAKFGDEDFVAWRPAPDARNAALEEAAREVEGDCSILALNRIANRIRALRTPAAPSSAPVAGSGGEG